MCRSLRLIDASCNSPPGLVLAPFRGVRYAQDRVSGLADVTSPPYDVIAADIEDQLIAADPHNVVRLILPRPIRGRPGSSTSAAAVLLRQWLAEQILVADPEPALYVYEQAESVNGCQPRRGRDAAARADRAVTLVAARGRHRAAARGCNPGPWPARLQLMEATQANLEPIFLLYDGRRGRARPRSGVGDRRQTAARVRCWRRARATACGTGCGRSRGERLPAIAADLAPRQALIADGHHRYAAYLRLRERRHEAGDGAGALGSTGSRCLSTPATTRRTSGRSTGSSSA